MSSSPSSRPIKVESLGSDDTAAGPSGHAAVANEPGALTGELQGLNTRLNNLKDQFAHACARTLEMNPDIVKKEPSELRVFRECGREYQLEVLEEELREMSTLVAELHEKMMLYEQKLKIFNGA